MYTFVYTSIVHIQSLCIASVNSVFVFDKLEINLSLLYSFLYIWKVKCIMHISQDVLSNLTKLISCGVYISWARIYCLASMIDACMYLSREWIFFGNNPTGIFAKIVFYGEKFPDSTHTHFKKKSVKYRWNLIRQCRYFWTERVYWRLQLNKSQFNYANQETWIQTELGCSKVYCW